MWKAVTEVLLRMFGVPAVDLAKVRSMSFGEGKMKDDAGDSTNPNVMKARELKGSGNSFFKSQEYSAAIQKYSEAISIPGLSFIDLATLYANRSISFLRLRDFESAKDDAKGAVLVHSTWSKAYFRLASAYEAMGKLKRALHNYELAAGLAPNNLDVKAAHEHYKYDFHKRSRDEHLDPMVGDSTFARRLEKLYGMGLKTSANKILNNQRVNSKLGLPLGICAEGHNYAHGLGRKQDYEQAARCYAQAASAKVGNAEGLYNLGILTMEGKGVRRDYLEAIRLVQDAAAQDPVMEFMGLKGPNLGVREAEHVLGLWHATGVGFPQDYGMAIPWYERGIKHGMGFACNNLALLYSNGKGVKQNGTMALALWKLGVYYGTTRAAENLALEYLRRLDRANAWNWFDYAVGQGCFSLKARKDDFLEILGPNSSQQIDPTRVWEGLKVEVEAGPAKHLLCTDPILLNFRIEKCNVAKSGQDESPPATLLGDPYTRFIIIAHRAGYSAQLQETLPRKESRT